MGDCGGGEGQISGSGFLAWPVGPGKCLNLTPQKTSTRTVIPITKYLGPKP